MNETTNDQNPAELSPLDGSRGVGDLLRSDPARVARYAEALRSIDNATLERTNFGRLTATYDESARAVVAVADEERADLVAEVERLKRGGKTLGEIIDKQCQMVLDATGLHDWVDEDGDGDWGAIWDHLFVLRDRARAAEAKVAKVEALADEWESFGRVRVAYHWDKVGQMVRRAVLADAPAEQRTLNCPVCGNGEEGDCICVLAEQIAEAEWNANGLAVREGPWSAVSIIKRRSLIIKALPEAAEQRAEGGA